MNLAIKKLRAKVWPAVIDLWIAAVLVVFLVLRVGESNTAKHLLKLLGRN